MSMAPDVCPIGGSIALYTRPRGLEKPVLFASIHRLSRKSFRWTLNVRGADISGRATTQHQAAMAATAAYQPGMKVRK